MKYDCYTVSVVVEAITNYIIIRYRTRHTNPFETENVYRFRKLLSLIEMTFGFFFWSKNIKKQNSRSKTKNQSVLVPTVSSVPVDVAVKKSFSRLFKSAGDRDKLVPLAIKKMGLKQNIITIRYYLSITIDSFVI